MYATPKKSLTSINLPSGIVAVRHGVDAGTSSGLSSFICEPPCDMHLPLQVEDVIERDQRRCRGRARVRAARAPDADSPAAGACSAAWSGCLDPSSRRAALP